MRLKRPLLAAIGVAAVLLVAGRVFAFLYTEHAWYAALGARWLWLERITDVVLLQVTAFIAAAAFAFTNLSAVRHSILSLILPRRLANVEFAEAVPPQRLDIAAVVLALVIAALAASALPDWTALALARLDATFGEMDPYHRLDLGFYTTWLPLEIALHRWAWVVLAITALTVIGLYALTPGLRWEEGTLRMTSYVRRHFAVLVAIVLLMLAWRARLASFTLLFEGSGPDGAFTAVDHRWRLPGYVLLSIATLAAAGVFLWSAWMRHIGLSVTMLAAVLFLWIGVQQILPLLVRSPVPDRATILPADEPYIATREAFTERAYDDLRAGEPAERMRAGMVLSRTAAVARAVALAHVGPGARGYVLVSAAPPAAVGASAPQIETMTSRLAHAWVEQDTRLLRDDLPVRPRILRVRDVRERVQKLAPIFAQGSRPAALFHADTLYWVTDLYTTSITYPLSRRFTLGGERRGYFRHAATAYIHGVSGTVTIVAEPSPDPIARAWQSRFPELVMRAEAEPAWIAELALEPTAPLVPAEPEDPGFRETIWRLYLRMRAALSVSDLAAFGAAFDSLGALLAPPGEPAP